MDLAAGALEDDAEHARFGAEGFEAGAIVVLERRAIQWKQRLPARSGGTMGSRSYGGSVSWAV